MTRPLAVPARRGECRGRPSDQAPASQRGRRPRPLARVWAVVRGAGANALRPTIPVVSCLLD